MKITGLLIPEWIKTGHYYKCFGELLIRSGSLLFFLLWPYIFSAQKKATDSLMGFDYHGANIHARHCHNEQEKEDFMNYVQRQFINEKYHLKTKLVEARPGAIQTPQPAGCTNIDFESNNTNGWTMTGDYQIMSGGTDPFGNFPCVYPGGGNYSLRLNDNNINGKTNFQASASRIINVTQLNSYLNLHFAMVIENYPHTAAQAAKFKIRVYDMNNQLLACPQFDCYYDILNGPVGANNFQQSNVMGMNTNNQLWPVTCAPWQTIGLDLSPYMGQNIKLVLSCDWCIYHVDWAYCYIDADCYGSYNPLSIGCGNFPFNICGPTGMQSYTWTAPGNMIISNSVCCNAPGPGIYTLVCTQYNTCGPSTVTYTFNVQPLPAAAFNYTYAPCNSNAFFQDASTANGGVPITNYVWHWNDGSPNSSGPTQPHNFPPGQQTVELVITNAGGCKDSIKQFLNITPPVNFTLNTISSSNSITCANPFVQMVVVSDYTFGTLNYNWSGPAFSSTNTSVILTSGGSYTVSAIDPATGCSQTQTFAVGVNTTVPISSVNPLNQFVDCATASVVTFTGMVQSPTLNILQAWYSPFNPPPSGVPIATSGNSISLLYVSTPGIYTLIASVPGTGCYTIKTVTVSSLVAFPTFSLNSPTNFSLGCAPLNQTTISIVGAASTQSPPATCSYTFLPPSFGGTVANMGSNTSTITQIPGSWTVIVQDNSNSCKSSVVVPLIQNTIAPYVSAGVITQTLTCFHPTVLATGTSTTANTIISWMIPSNPPLLPSPTVVLGPPSGPNTSSTSLNYANYTVVATNTLNACQSTSVIMVSQNFKPPVSSPTVSIGTPTAVYCTSGKNPVVLTTGNSTVTSLPPPGAFAVPLLWHGPSPQQDVSYATTYSACIPGIYTLTIEDSYNGCTSTGTVQVLDKTQHPVLASDTTDVILDCGATETNLIAQIIGSSSDLRYWYFQYPPASHFSPNDATLSNANTLLSGTASQTVNTDKTGDYIYLVTNTITGCQTRGYFHVVDGILQADFDPDQYNGFAPMTVEFSNNSTSTTGSGSITSVWNYGNGTSQTTSANISTSALYKSPGTYTVMLIAAKGSCLDAIYKVIRVELPSKLEVPNVFTPNGDGSNDVFFLNTSNLTKINVMIYDRWGNKVYETSSDSGNIGWDGKTFSGKECAEGCYFYIISAKGADDKAYTRKGNVSLFR